MPRSQGQLAPAPKLERPGAGLPWFELLWVRLLFSAARLLISDDRATRWFKTEARKVLKLAGELDSQAGARLVLVPRLAGLEDSSRHWSAYMVLEHLCIVNDTVIQVIDSFHGERPYGKEIKIEAVKPLTSAGPEMIDRFEALAARYVGGIDQALASASRARHAHPWFGPLNARGWHCFAPIHTALHRRQLESIIKNRDGQEAS